MESEVYGISKAHVTSIDSIFKSRTDAVKKDPALWNIPSHGFLTVPDHFQLPL